LERRSLAHNSESPSSPVPFLKSTAFMPPAPSPSPPHLLPANRTFIYIQMTLTYPLVLSGTFTYMYLYIVTVFHSTVNVNSKQIENILWLSSCQFFWPFIGLGYCITSFVKTLPGLFSLSTFVAFIYKIIKY
jgi:hypothetical protein